MIERLAADVLEDGYFKVLYTKGGCNLKSV